MKKFLLSIAVLLACSISTRAVDANTVEIIYNGTSATVNIASNISSYVTVSSGNSSHVVITQSSDFNGIDATVDNEDGEIIYTLSGTSTDGEFYLDGSFKCTVELNGVTLTNPNGPAINIQNGKRVALSAQKGKVNTIADGANEDYNGAIHCKGHLKLKGKGTLNVTGNSRHGIYSKEYMEVKNVTLNVSSAAKDALHCKEYFLMESGVVTLSGAGDDAIQVELSNDTATGETTDHEDENSGNFYQLAGTLNISNYQGKAIKADGTVTFTAGTQNFDTSDVETTAAVSTLVSNTGKTSESVYDLNGHRQLFNSLKRGLYIVKKGDKTVKAVVR